MFDKGSTIGPETQRQLAAELFNETWTLLDKQQRSQEDDDLMIHAAHASAYHWRQVGQPLNFARSHWQLSRVYAVLGRPDCARHHAQRSLAICQAESIADFDLAFAFEALARAAAVAGLPGETQRYLTLAQAAGAQIVEEDDRQHFFAELATIPTT